MKTMLKLFYEWEIQFEKPLEKPDQGSRTVRYGEKLDLPHRAIAVYLYLADRANKEQECRPAIPTVT